MQKIRTPRSAWVYPRPCGGNSVLVGPVHCRMVYPRPCGGNRGRGLDSSARAGLSPPVRGKHWIGSSDSLVSGSIPARAGETANRPLASGLMWVYPRPCGGNRGRGLDSSARAGLSPPVRGKHWIGSSDSLVSGSIPARAGETANRPLASGLMWVYPRPCGGNVQHASRIMDELGLSPPVRGKLHRA